MATARKSTAGSAPQPGLSMRPARRPFPVAAATPRARRTSNPDASLSRALSRSERLSHALRRGFVAARVVAPRASSGPLSDLIGPLAPERYLGLRRRSRMAARALVAVALAKAQRDVARLESFRRTSSMPARDAERAAGPPESDWFDCVSASLLEPDVTTPAFKEAIGSLRALRLPPNKSPEGTRSSQLPAEAFRVERTGGIDFSEAIAPAPGPTIARAADEHVTAGGSVQAPTTRKPEPELIELDGDDLPPVPSVASPAPRPSLLVPDSAEGPPASARDIAAVPDVDVNVTIKPHDEAKALQKSTTEATAALALPHDPSLALSDTKRTIMAASEAGPLSKDPAPDPGLRRHLEGLSVTEAEPSTFIEVADTFLPDIDLTASLAVANVDSTGKIDAMDIEAACKALPEGNETQSQPVVDDEGDAVLEGNGAMPSAPAPEPASQFKLAANELLDLTTGTVRGERPASLDQDRSSKMRTDDLCIGRVSIGYDDSTGKVFVHFDVVPRGYSATNRQDILGLSDPNLLNGSAQEKGMGSLPDVEIISDSDPSDPAEVACIVRKDAPPSMLQEMLDDLNRKEASPSNRRRRSIASEKIVNVDKNDMRDHTRRGKGTPALSGKRSKRGRNGLSDKQREQKRARMREAIEETLQDDREVRRRTTERSSVLVNGHRPQARTNGDSARRYSTRARKPAPIVDSSSDGEAFVSNQPDDDFDIEEEISKTVEKAEGQIVSERPPARVTRSSIASRQPAGITGRQPRNMNMVPTPNARRRSSSPPGQRGDPAAVRDVSKKGKRSELWETEIVACENMEGMGTPESPSVSSAEESDNPICVGLRRPILRRLLKPCWEDDRCVNESDAFDEHGEMMQHYKDSRNDPSYGSPRKSPGLQFAMELFGGTGVAALDRVAVMDGDIRLAGEGPGSMGIGTVTDGALYIPAGAAASGDPDAGNSFAPHMTRYRKGRRSNRGAASSASRESSDLSSGGSDSSDDADYVKTPKVRKKSKDQVDEEVRAKDLHERVCGDAIHKMDPDIVDKVKRWSAKDFSWFDKGADMMELLAVKQKKLCLDCDNLKGEQRCEESIMLKVWKNLSWRKVRRMRHLGRGLG